MTQIFLHGNPQCEGENYGRSNITTSLSLQVKGCLVKGLHLFLLRTHLVRNAYNLLGLQQLVKAISLEDFDPFLRDTLLEDFKDLLQVCPINRSQ